MKLFKSKEDNPEKASRDQNLPGFKLSDVIPKPRDIPIKAKNKLKEYARVLRITKKPSQDEYKAIVKASALGMVVIGMVGFAIHMIAQALTLYR